MVDLLLVTTCLSSTEGAILMFMFPTVAIFFVVVGLVTRVPLLGVFGALLLLVSSLFLSPCVGFFSLLLFALSLFLIVFFATQRNPTARN